MRKILTLGMICLSISLFASKSADWHLPVEGKPVNIFKHNFTGIPILETSTHYYGLNHVSQAILWSVEKSKTQNATEAASSAAAMSGVGGDMVGDVAALTSIEAFKEITYTPFVSIHNRFVDVGSGNILMGTGEDVYKEILSDDIIPELYMLLVKVKAEDGSRVVYAIDLETRKVSWKQKLAEPSGTKDVLKKAAGAAGVSGMSISIFAPKATADGNIVYKNDNDLLLLNAKDGSIAWRNECKPGTFFMDDKQTKLISIEKASGASSMMSTSGVGKEMMAIDIKTGKMTWSKPVKLDEKFRMHLNIDASTFVVAHKKGLNICNFETGEMTWKKDFGAENIKEITVKPEGIEVFYGNKLMLIDKTTGKKAWKKAIEFDVDESEEGSMITKDYDKGVFMVGQSYVGLYNRESGKKIWAMGCGEGFKTAFDNVNNKVAVMDGKKLYVFNPEEVAKKPEKIKLDIEEPSEITGFETMKDGYFIQGLNEYIFVDKSVQPKSQNYYKPLKTDRLLKAALYASAMSTAVMSTEITMTDADGNVVASGGAFMDTESARAMGDMSDAQIGAYRKLQADAALKGASVGNRDFAFFLKGEKTDAGDKMSIVKIEKNSGKEVDSFDFGDNRKVVFELDKQANKLYFLDEGSIKVYNL